MIFRKHQLYKETLIKFKITKIILADGGAFVGAFIMARSHDHANVKPNRLNIANRAVKHYAEIPTGISAVDVGPVRACRAFRLYV